ncbi:MAG TPA: hypothetical protein VEI06_04700 [Gemmatimonadaceae bacterium]|nr:hypothetical protein [Gemmatimonadaceae bacterium]
MEFLVMLEEHAEHSPVMARVDSVPAELSTERRARDVVTLYGTPRTESLALALAAAVESHRTEDGGRGAFRHLGLFPERGAVGDAAWRDETTGELVTRDLDIPFDVLANTAHRLLAECGAALQRVVAGLAMPDWPEGAWRAISITLDPVLEPTRAALSKLDSVLDVFREADGLTYDYEGD